jgi:hypothetical protein
MTRRSVCASELRFIRPGYARDATGQWQVIVQTDDLPQRVAIDLCHAPEQPCECHRHTRGICGQFEAVSWLNALNNFKFNYVMRISKHKVM